MGTIRKETQGCLHKKHKFKTMDIIYYRRKPWDYKNYRKDVKNRNTEEEARWYDD